MTITRSIPKILPHTKCAHYFAFEGTLTRSEVEDWRENKSPPPTQEAVVANLKAEMLATFRAILAAGDYLAVITHGADYRVGYFLERSGLSEDEIRNIMICGGNTHWIIPGYKAESILTLAKTQFADATHHFFYENRARFREEVLPLNEVFLDEGKTLTVYPVLSEADSMHHLLYAKIIAQLPSREHKHCMGSVSKLSFLHQASLSNNHADLLNSHDVHAEINTEAEKGNCPRCTLL